MLAKGKGFSYCKGNEITTNDPAAKIVGKDTPLFKLECSEDKEGGHDPDSECAPLIDPWYDAYAHFLVVPGDYLPSVPGCVWLSICCRDTEVSWAPLASSIPNLDIHQGTSLPVPILFKFGLGTSLGWKEWVDEELVDMGFMAVKDIFLCNWYIL